MNALRIQSCSCQQNLVGDESLGDWIILRISGESRCHVLDSSKAPQSRIR